MVTFMVHSSLKNVFVCLDWLQNQSHHLQLLHHGKLLLAAGGGAVPAHLADGHLLREQTFYHLSTHWMG